MNRTSKSCFSTCAALRLKNLTHISLRLRTFQRNTNDENLTRGGAYGTQTHTRFERIPASLLSSPKEFVEQLFTAYLEMRSHIGKDCRERANTKRAMLGNREMMFAVLVGSKAGWLPVWRVME